MRKDPKPSYFEIPRFRKLSGVFVGGAIFLVIAKVLSDKSLKKGLTTHPAAQETLRKVSEYKDLVNFMGAPIQVGNINIYEQYFEEIEEDLEGVLKLPIFGSKLQGISHTNVSRENTDQDWRIDQILVSINTIEGKKVRVFKREE